MVKEDRSVWLIFFEGLKIFCLNIHKYLLYMTFPVIGQLVGIFAIFGPTYWFTQNYQDLLIKYPALNDMSTMLICTVVMAVPGLLILMKALWDYMVAYCSLNSMTEGYLNTGRVYDFRAHNEVVYKKMFSFVALWFLFGMFSVLALIPVFWILGFIFFIYFILIFQVFTFENGLSPVGYFRRSLELIRGKFSRTFMLMFLLGIFCFVLLSSGLSVIFDYLNLTTILGKSFEAWAYTMPIEALEPYGVNPALIGKSLTNELIFFITIGFTLPLRSICWTLWYNNLSEPIEKPKKNISKTVTKKVNKKGKKLPENFKIEKRGIDPEIIRRARMEDDEY
jgi:hypothetical protein